MNRHDADSPIDHHTAAQGRLSDRAEYPKDCPNCGLWLTAESMDCPRCMAKLSSSSGAGSVGRSGDTDGLLPEGLVSPPASDSPAAQDRCGCDGPLIACEKCGDSRCLSCDPYDASDTCSAARTIEPVTQEEINLFCEEDGVVRPDPNDERAVCSFASWFARWRHERRHGAGSW